MPPTPTGAPGRAIGYQKDEEKEKKKEEEEGEKEEEEEEEEEEGRRRRRRLTVYPLVSQPVYNEVIAGFKALRQAMARTRDRRFLADFKADSLATMPSTPPSLTYG
ncbi:hypothetical protein PoB_001969100 [Plakobranchus ocellatus]|uniref:Uncharacterized protein n=1 Tax=Plakobranchus ocellatus TaxID=259542 RepID=A0AAV3Z1J2_9GAST|nr:hypothetical protein PoB_001969100 [Plakobranchus ocellatus]